MTRELSEMKKTEIFRENMFMSRFVEKWTVIDVHLDKQEIHLMVTM